MGLCTIEESTLQELMNFLSLSRHLPEGWTIAKVLQLATQIQTEIAANRKE